MAVRTFVLIRDEDVTGTSGIGIVAEGCVFTDGTAVMRWLTAATSTAIYRDLEDLIEIHGHGGKTRVELLA